MTEITTQGIIEQINRTTIESIQIKGKIAEVKQRLSEYPENIELEKMNQLLKEITDKDTELRDMAKDMMVNKGMKKFEALD
jgi:hypothetical protein